MGSLKPRMHLAHTTTHVIVYSQPNDHTTVNSQTYNFGCITPINNGSKSPPGNVALPHYLITQLQVYFNTLWTTPVYNSLLLPYG